jgi:hypothetical protein
VPGFPIRTPWDHRLVDSSPRPIAASHVLHRLLVPRHPPSALDNLTTKMLASTVQFSNNKQTHNPTTTTHPQHPGKQSTGPCKQFEWSGVACPKKPPHTPTNTTHKGPARQEDRGACSFRTQQGAFNGLEPNQPHPTPPSTPTPRKPRGLPNGEAVLGMSWGRCRPGMSASVSATEQTRPPHSDEPGSWTPLQGHEAP